MSASIKIQYFFSVFGSSGPRLNIFTDSFLKNSLVGIENETMDSAVTACEVQLSQHKYYSECNNNVLKVSFFPLLAYSRVGNAIFRYGDT